MQAFTMVLMIVAIAFGSAGGEEGDVVGLVTDPEAPLEFPEKMKRHLCDVERERSFGEAIELNRADAVARGSISTSAMAFDGILVAMTLGTFGRDADGWLSGGAICRFEVTECYWGCRGRYYDVLVWDVGIPGKLRYDQQLMPSLSEAAVGETFRVMAYVKDDILRAATLSGSKADVGSRYSTETRDLLEMIPAVPSALTSGNVGGESFALLVQNDWRLQNVRIGVRPPRVATAPAYLNEHFYGSITSDVSIPWLNVTALCDVWIEILDLDGSTIDTFVFEAVEPANYCFAPGRAYLPLCDCIVRLSIAGEVVNEIQVSSGFDRAW